jgi:hypothetical protein
MNSMTRPEQPTLEGFVQKYMPKTFADPSGMIEHANAQIAEAVPDPKLRAYFERKVLIHLKNHLFQVAGVELARHSDKLKSRFENAVLDFMADVSSIYGSPFVVIEVPLHGLKGRFPVQIHQPSDVKITQILQRGARTHLQWVTGYLADELAPAFPQDTAKAFLDRYRGEGARYVREAKHAIELVVRYSRQKPSRREYALNAGTFYLVEFLREDGRGSNGRRLSIERACEIVASIFGGYFRFVGPPRPEPWDPDGASIERGYRRARILAKRSEAMR